MTLYRYCRKLSRHGLSMTILLAVIGLGSAMLLTGCNTMEGVGEDVEAAGENIQEAAD